MFSTVLPTPTKVLPHLTPAPTPLPDVSHPVSVASVHVTTIIPVLSQLAHDPATQIFFIAPLLFILLDVLSGMVAAVRQRRFQLKQIANFGRENLVKYAGILLGSLLVPLVGGMPYEVAAVAAKATMSAFVLSEVASITENLGEVLDLPYRLSLAVILQKVVGLFPFVSNTPVPVATTGLDPLRYDEGMLTNPVQPVVTPSAPPVVPVQTPSEPQA